MYCENIHPFSFIYYTFVFLLFCQITTTTKVIREVHHVGPDGEVLDSYQVGEYNPYGQAPPQPGYAMDSYRPHSPASEAGELVCFCVAQHFLLTCSKSMNNLILSPKCLLQE